MDNNNARRSSPQVVTVENGYAYEWHGDEPLRVGDKVLLPSNWTTAGDWVGEVTGLGTTYAGPLRAILGRA